MNKVHSFLVEAALWPVKFYRKFISSSLGFRKCKYLPTCSQYALDAFREWGIFVGFFLSVWRILRCNPFSKGGYDPVPRRKRKNAVLPDAGELPETEESKEREISEENEKTETEED